ncbi:DNA ligase 4 [Rhagoletis pomonella]|uniref:DNA ligase 4 n=1 Tax=Rhagoletis pomonella TaxID=28610 RepID=UPI00178026CF|nr:DNA ligase 4 [Rhagoletis pomonella]XP_036318907.1 DNA ligase 4 [Rhagoletis pomonella]
MDISKNIKFADICSMLDKVKNAKNQASKEKILRRYYESFQKFRQIFRKEQGVPPECPEDGSSSFFSVLRCLIPRDDMSRKAYGLQITTLGNVYIDVLQLPKDSNDVQRLQARTYNGPQGDYADIVYAVLMPRCRHEPSELSLYEVHQMLDTIAEDDRQDTKKVLTRLAEIASAQEQMWFIRLLLKNMHLGIGEQRIFGLMHPQARDLNRRCSNLKRVCCLLADNKISTEYMSAQEAPGEQNRNVGTFNLNKIVQPFQHIQAMLCEMFRGSIEQLMAEDVLYLETKMDGERFQLHYANERFKYISRNGIDYTHSFGENYKSGPLTPLLESLLPGDLQSIILDGEMMVYDTQQKCYRDKGENTDVKHLGNRKNWRPCFVVYDVLYFNGNSFLEIPYAQRCQKVVELIRGEEPGILQIMRPIKITEVEQFQQLFQKALDSKQEGIVLKKQNSTYRPGTRVGGGWYKIKADYIAGLTTEFDLLIIGGFYNRTRTFIQSFLLGVLKYTSDTQYAVYSVGKVDNRTRQSKRLNDALKQHWQDSKMEPPPDWYHYKATSPEGRPDVWIQPSKSVILQIRATDLSPSSAFALAKSLHFPRIEMWRNDKLWKECLSIHDYMEMIQGERGIKKIHKREVELGDLTGPQKKRKLTLAERRKLGILSYEKRFNPDEIEQCSNLFEGFSFCILSASLKNGYTPEDLKAIVVSNGGEVVENPIQDPKCISVAGDKTFRVETLCKSRRYNIAKLKWLVDTCKRQELQLTPTDMVCITHELEAEFSQIFDKYGDPFTECTDVEQLMKVLDGIQDEDLVTMDSSKSKIAELETILYDDTTAFFSNCFGTFYSIDQNTQLAKLIYQYLGGQCFDDLNDDNIQTIKYVFINSNLIDKTKLKAWILKRFKKRLGNLHVVNIAWILHSHRAKRKLDVYEYMWKEF